MSFHLLKMILQTTLQKTIHQMMIDRLRKTDRQRNFEMNPEKIRRRKTGSVKTERILEKTERIPEKIHPKRIGLTLVRTEKILAKILEMTLAKILAKILEKIPEKKSCDPKSLSFDDH